MIVGKEKMEPRLAIKYNNVLFLSLVQQAICVNIFMQGLLECSSIEYMVEETRKFHII